MRSFTPRGVARGYGGLSVSVRTEGRIVDENNAAVAGLRVAVRWPAMLFGNELGSATTAASGAFSVGYGPDPLEPAAHRELELVVQDEVGRVLLSDGFDDVSAPTHTRPDDVIRSTETGGLLATLGTGQPTRLTDGNTVTAVMDHAAFAHAAELFATAKKEILMSQLFFAFPPAHDPDKPTLVFDFDRGSGLLPIDAEPGRAVVATDKRPELLLVAAATRGVDVRVLLHGFEFPLLMKLVLGAIVFPFFNFAGALSVRHMLSDQEWTDTDEAQRYFARAGLPNLEVRLFKQPILTAGVMHAKLVVADANRALSIGSPFGQTYVDGYDHRIAAPMRGASDGLPKHDAGFAVTGPAVAHFRETLKLLWETDDSATDPLGPPPSEPPPPATGADGTCSMQIVRTLSSGRFKAPIPDDGEKGILEAYLRAIKAAEELIYLETQYFTDDAIGYALAEAMKRNRRLRVIVLLNITPDVPFYPFKQRRLITRIREAIGETHKLDEAPTQFGVFTRWAYEPSPSTPVRSRMLPVYIHAKVGIVDNAWATVGSANLDGLSLDSSYPSDIFRKLFGAREQRAVEVNGVMLNDAAHPSDVIDILRRKLWAEHLNYTVSGARPETLDIGHQDLALNAQSNWLQFWWERAEMVRLRLIATPRADHDGLARVLPWPTEDTTFKAPRVHLDALGVKTYSVVPLKSTRKFDFRTGAWDPESKLEMDYP